MYNSPRFGLDEVSVPQLKNSLELDFDQKTGMKNYIANEDIGITTSTGYIRTQLQECIAAGRRGRRGDEGARHEAFRRLGAALHTLEDFSAHSNYTELAIRKLGEPGIFACVGDGCRIRVHGTGELVPPLVTGTFGMLDIYASLIGEIDDKAAAEEKSSLTDLDKVGLKLLC